MSTRWDRGSTRRHAFQRSAICLTLQIEPRPWTSADLSNNKALQDLAMCMFTCAQVPPPNEVKAIANCKAALVAQRPFLKPVSKMPYSYTPQTHFCIKNNNNKPLCLLVREAKDRSVSARLNEMFLAFIARLSNGIWRGDEGSKGLEKKSLPSPSVSATYLCAAQTNVHLDHNINTLGI